MIIGFYFSISRICFCIYFVSIRKTLYGVKLIKKYIITNFSVSKCCYKNILTFYLILSITGSLYVPRSSLNRYVSPQEPLEASRGVAASRIKISKMLSSNFIFFVLKEVGLESFCAGSEGTLSSLLH